MINTSGFFTLFSRYTRFHQFTFSRYSEFYRLTQFSRCMELAQFTRYHTIMILQGFSRTILMILTFVWYDRFTRFSHSVCLDFLILDHQRRSPKPNGHLADGKGEKKGSTGPVSVVVFPNYSGVANGGDSDEPPRSPNSDINLSPYSDIESNQDAGLCFLLTFCFCPFHYNLLSF